MELYKYTLIYKKYTKNIQKHTINIQKLYKNYINI